MFLKNLAISVYNPWNQNRIRPVGKYLLNIEIDATAHDALGDVSVLEKLYERLKKKLNRKALKFSVRGSLNQKILVKNLLFLPAKKD